MTDGLGREITYLRISITDLCNLRCIYCMPEDGITRLRHEDVLSFEEIARLTGILAGMGISKVRLTGGEPLVRRGMTTLVGMLGDLPGIDGLHLTTNGILLKERARDLKAAGLCGVNVSLDTLDADKFGRMSRGGSLRAVIDGIDEALMAGLTVKLNCVPVRGHNEEDLIPLCEFASGRGISLRFIELMPLGEATAYEGVGTDGIRQVLSDRFGEGTPLEPDGGPAAYYDYGGMRIGFIRPISDCFCPACNRIRLTADGYLKLCLHHLAGIDLRAPLRDGSDDDQVRSLIKSTMQRKPSSHDFAAGVQDPDARRMVQIGG